MGVMGFVMGEQFLFVLNLLCLSLWVESCKR